MVACTGGGSSVGYNPPQPSPKATVGEVTPNPSPTPANPQSTLNITELVRASTDYKVYLIKDNQKQWIKTPQEFISLGLDWNKVSIITPEQLASYPDYADNTKNTPISYFFSRNLKLRDKGTDVKELQILLNNKGFVISMKGPGSSGKETDLFGSLTKKALIKFQEAYKQDILIPAGLKKGTGIFGSLTRGFVNGNRE